MNKNLATLLVLWLGSGAWWGMESPVPRVSARNKVAGKLLCEAFRAANALRNSVNVSQNLKNEIKLAVYGAPDRVQFDEGGNFRHSSLFRYGTQYPREKVCEYYGNNRGRGQVDGIFAESLFGAFVCVCAPPITNRYETLCGVRHWERRRAWSGNFNWGGRHHSLLQDVWDEVISKCKAGVNNHESHLTRLGNLAKALTAIRNELRWHRASGGDVHILGDTRDIRGCSGKAGKEVCAAYKYEAWKRGVPWIQSLWHVLHQLYAEYEKAVGPRITVTVPQPSPQTSGTHGNPGTSWTSQESQPYQPHQPREVLVDEQGHTIVLDDDTFPEDLPNSTEAGWEAEENETSNPVQGPIPNPTSDLDPTSPEAAEGIVAHLTAAAHEGGASITPACAWRLFTATVALLG
ncbi:Variant surface glycoprotein [Trypanosoma congolense IL3000]|uniref:Variant surface glycoprotein n=1 Tax=Trypanosoma congolense (strain IL3000) TaxID=1068625 RepID=F9WIF9_TRYCI|nr:Variant surface glycoprotein [Trypanosoma congolense IL3000]